MRESMTYFFEGGGCPGHVLKDSTNEALVQAHLLREGVARFLSRPNARRGLRCVFLRGKRALWQAEKKAI